MLDPFQLEFVQRGVLEVLLLSGAAGLLGTWIVMRGLSFYAHAVGTAAFPGLVLADGLGFSAPLGAFAAALVFAFGVERLARRPRAGYDSLTALVLVAALAGGVVLASDVFHSGGDVDSLLFGSLLLTGTRDLVLAGAASAAAVAATLVARPALARARVRSGRGARTRPALAAPRRGPARARGVRRRGLADGDRRAARDVAVRRAGGHGAALDAAPRRLAARLGRARGGPGHRRAVAVGRAQHAAGPDRRRHGRRALRALAAAPAARRRSGAAARCSPAAAVLLALALTACGCGSRARRRAAGRRGDDDADRRLGARRRRRRRRRAPDPAAQHRPARVRAAAGRRRGRARREARAPQRRPARRLDGHGALERRRLAGGASTWARRCRCGWPGESDGPEASRFDPHWWHDPRNAEAAVGAIRDALDRGRSAQAPAPIARNAAAYLAPPARARRRHPRVPRGRARRAAQARLRPRRVRLLRAALRHRDRRRRDPLADDAGAGLGAGHRRRSCGSCGASTCARSSPRSR